MFRKIALVSRVYIESLLFVSVLLTSSFVFIVYVNTEPQNISLPGLILGRILVFTPVLYMFYEFKKKEFIYYRNLGLSQLRLLIYLELLDAALSMVIIIISYVIIK